MSKVFLMVATLLVVFSLAISAHAVITFDEVALYSTDPTIEGVSFFAGDPANLNDTYTDDSWTPGNAYLASGYDDGTGNSPDVYDSFIGAEALGFKFLSFTFDIASEYQIPPDTTLWALALSAGTEVASMSLVVSDWDYHAMTLSSVNGFDTVYIYDNLDTNGFGEAFHIDNVAYNKENGDVPEPATILLLGTGLGGVFLMRRTRKK